MVAIVTSLIPLLAALLRLPQAGVMRRTALGPKKMTFIT